MGLGRFTADFGNASGHGWLSVERLASKKEKAPKREKRGVTYFYSSASAKASSSCWFSCGVPMVRRKQLVSNRVHFRNVFDQDFLRLERLENAGSCIGVAVKTREQAYWRR
jgi:hypothetical protein